MAMKAQIIYPTNIKGWNMPFSWDSDEGWKILSWNGAKSTDKELYYQVAAVRRAIELNSNVVANVPFAVMDANGNDIATSDDMRMWNKTIPFFRYPRNLLRRWRTSLAMTNTAFGFIERERGQQYVRYIAPSTMEIVSGANGIDGFNRTIGTQKTFIPIDSGLMIYFLLLGYDDELIPGGGTEFDALRSAAGILFSADYWVENFFKSGGIKPSMLMVKGVPSRDERALIETAWDRLRKNFYKFAGKIFNAEAMEVKELGNGIADMKGNSSYMDAITNIALATGIPKSLLLDDSANYATAEISQTVWYSHTITPTAMQMADALTNQLFARFGMTFEFRPEQGDPDSKDTQERAASYATLITAGMLPSIAAQVAGLMLPANVSYEDLDEVEEEEAPETLPEQPEDTPEDEAEDAAEVEADTTRSWIPNTEQTRIIATWSKMAARKHKHSDPLPLDFTNPALPDWYIQSVKSRLTIATTPADIDAAFEITAEPEPVKTETVTPAPDYTGLFALADAINNAVKAEPAAGWGAPPSVTVNMPSISLTAQMPEQGTPSVTVNIPEQPAPVVTVTNEVNPTPVSVEVTNEVQPAPVTVQAAAPKSATVTYPDGRKLKLEAK